MNWKAAYIESRVLAASPLELIDILYEYAILYVETAQQELARGDIEGRTRAVSKVVAIIGELEGSLDYSTGGEIAANLARLYRYMQERLLTGNLKQESAPLAEVEGLLKTLGQAWKEVCSPQAESPTAAAPVSAPGPWSAPTPDPAAGYTSYSCSA